MSVSSPEQKVTSSSPNGNAPSVAGIGHLAHRGDGPVLQAIGLSKLFKQFVAVDNLSFDVAQGEVLGFLGPNGAGKSTTVGMILGLIKPTSGSVKIMGTDLSTNSAIVPENIGAIIENPAFYPYLSGRDNLKS
ncbi:MAG: ATP-binding cassette domain-containing protein, partial [Thermomicrobiales bacterium]